MRIKIVFGIIFLSLLSACSQTMFEFSDGSTKSLSVYKGQWLLVNYWAVWCKPCLKEIPELNLLNASEKITVVGVNFDQQTGRALELQIKKMGIKFPVLSHDPAVLFAQNKPSVLPATMVINPQGVFQFWLIGPQTKESVDEAIQNWLHK